MDPIMMFALLAGLLAMFYFSSRSAKRRMAEMERVRSAIEPGQWVRTGSGMYGIVADVDGEVVILQTPRGEESYWNIKAIVSAEEPPFAASQEEVADDAEALAQLDAELAEARAANDGDAASPWAEGTPAPEEPSDKVVTEEAFDQGDKGTEGEDPSSPKHP